MILVEFAVICDGGCSRSALEKNVSCFTAADAMLAAEQVGWFAIDGKHYCPDCAAKGWRGDIEDSVVRQRQLTGGKTYTNERDRTRHARAQANDEVRPLQLRDTAVAPSVPSGTI